MGTLPLTQVVPLYSSTWLVAGVVIATSDRLSSVVGNSRAAATTEPVELPARSTTVAVPVSAVEACTRIAAAPGQVAMVRPFEVKLVLPAPAVGEATIGVNQCEPSMV